jgi:hypothetical protein
MADSFLIMVCASLPLKSGGVLAALFKTRLQMLVSGKNHHRRSGDIQIRDMHINDGIGPLLSKASN